MGNNQEPLAAGLLSGLMALTSDGASDQEKMRSWSSLIGILTALVGNMLISVALNIQRYAHIRIDREFLRDRIHLESDVKRARSGRGATGAYGAVATGEQGSQDTEGQGESTFEPYRDEPLEPDHDLEGHARDQQHAASHDGLQESVSSDQTARPEDRDPQRGNRKSYLRSPYWWVGIVLMVLGEAGNFLAYGFAPASIVSPLGVVALIFNCVIAPFMLKEQFRKRDLWGVIIAIAGAVVVVLSAKSSEEKIGPHDIWMMITRWEFELYLGISAGLIVILMSLSGKYGSRTILVDVGLVALFGGYTALSTKGVSSLLSFKLWHVITFPVTYLLVFVLVFSALMQIRYINRALQRFDSTQVIPTQFVLFTLSVITGSAVLYRDFESFTAERAVKFVGGCLLTFLGVYFITSGRVRADDESSYSADDEEEAIGLLGGERYRDEVDVSPPGQDIRVNKPAQAEPEPHEELPQSPSGSLLSQGIDGLDDEQPTPKGVLSVAPSENGSLTTESLRAPSSPEPPQSLITNPWAESQERIISTPASEPHIRPGTPPRQAADPNIESTVLLRFPPAPGVHSHSPQHDANLQTQASSGPDRTAPQTPPSRRMRNSISVRFSPGALLPTLSAGFSAVVAESLRRGETSPIKDRKGRRRSDRRKQISNPVVDGALGSRPSESREVEYDSDGAVVEDSQAGSQSFATTTTGSKPNSTGEIPINAVSSSQRGDTNPQDRDGTDSNRIRSLSDSLSGPAWLGGVLRKPGKSSAAVVSEEDKRRGSNK